MRSQAVKSLDGIKKMDKLQNHTRHHYAIKKFFGGKKIRAQITDDHAAVFIYDPVDPCQSQIIVEHFHDEIPQTESTMGADIEQAERVGKFMQRELSELADRLETYLFGEK